MTTDRHEPLAEERESEVESAGSDGVLDGPLEARGDAEPPQHPELRELGERLERRAFWLGVVGALVFGIVVDLRAALVLTLTVAAAIVSIRGLRSQISVLSPIPGTSHSARSYVLVLTRALVLVVGLALIFRFGATRPTAVIAGVATLPTALFIEAIRQAFVNVD